MSKKKKILVFCDTFLPPAYKPRVRYFCNYFVKKGYDLTLITEYNSEQQLLNSNFPVYSIDYYQFRNNILYRFEWFFKIILNLFIPHKSIIFYKKSKKILKNQNFDIVFCSADFHSFPLTTAAMLAKKFNAQLFTDLRDIFEQSPDNKSFIARQSNNLIYRLIVNFYKKINTKRRNKVLKISNCVTSVSNWHVKILTQFNINTHLIYNGFDEDLFLPKIQKTDKFFISYFGEIYYEELRNPNILCAALKNLEKNGKISANNCCVKWFVNENSKKIIQKIVEKHNIEDFVSYEKQVANEQYVLELNKNSILLVLCNSSNNKKYSGIMTTKFFEYIGVNRPILCTPNNNDELAETINAIGCGLVSSDVEEVENFILKKYAEWQQNGFTKGTVSAEIREKFSRKIGAEILENLFENEEF